MTEGGTDNMLCDQCEKRAFCSSLCPEAELFISQDEAPQRELTIGLPKFGQFPNSVSKTYLTDMQNRIMNLMGQGLDRRQICESLDISRATLRKHLWNIRGKT